MDSESYLKYLPVLVIAILWMLINWKNATSDKEPKIEKPILKPAPPAPRQEPRPLKNRNIAKTPEEKKPQRRPSRASALLKKPPSLRNAWLMHEIFKRPE